MFILILFHVLCLICVTFVTGNECELPQQLENGNWTMLDGSNPHPGDKIPYNARILITCIDDFKAYPTSTLTCRDLLLLQPKCLSTCSSIAATRTTNVTCKFRGKDTSCQNPYHETIAYMSCAEHYENRNNDQRDFKCHFGNWNAAPKYECEPICGQRFGVAQEFIIAGRDAEVNEFTWQVAIYEKKGFYDQICGGTILTPKITLSAAHCFKKRNNPELYFVGAGKTFRNYLDPRDDNYTQYSNVSKIVIPEFFEITPESRYDYDIAIVVLTSPFEMTEFVLPACLDRNKAFNYAELENIQGIVTGWGYTKGKGSPSDRLQYLEVDYKSNETCRLRFDFKKYYFPYVRDKICAGRFREGKSVCKGDSGGGLMFRGEDNRFYVRGIVSIGPKKKGQCDAAQYSLFTSVSFHVDFILDQIKEYNVINVTETARKITAYEDGCILPKIENGKFEVYWRTSSDDYILKPGYPVRSGVELNIQCNEGYRKFPETFEDNMYYWLKCNKGWNVNAKCKRFCPTIEASNVNATCYLDDKIVSCEQPYDGVVAVVKCKESYVEATPFNNPYRYCEDGFWSDDIVDCQPNNKTKN